MAGLYGLTEDRQLSNSNAKPPFIPVHRRGFSRYFNKNTHDLSSINLNSTKDDSMCDYEFNWRVTKNEMN
jgi:hypothetical protein